LLVAGVGAGAASAGTCSSTTGTTSAAGTTISDCGFETPSVGGGWSNGPVLGPWTFTPPPYTNRIRRHYRLSQRSQLVRERSAPGG
jgi:hypothetical protein